MQADVPEDQPVPQRSDATPRRAVVVMGVSGCGKSSVGQGVATALGLDFIDGDDLHASASVAKMRAGTPLTDDDRRPWLQRIGLALANAEAHPKGLVVACSALKLAYRDGIRAAAPKVRFVFLDGDAQLIESRMRQRAGHYMPSSLLASQLQTLERPLPDEPGVITLSVAPPTLEVVALAVQALG